MIPSAVVRGLAPVAALVMCERLASHRCSSGTSPWGAPSWAAALEHSSARLPFRFQRCHAVRDLADGDLVVFGKASGADLHRRDGEGLA